MLRELLTRLGLLKPGSYRWSIKTGTDLAASQVVAEPRISTIAQLVAIPPPRHPKTRVVPWEMQTVSVTAVLTDALLEEDGDYHLVLSDLSGPNSTMIAEIPDPEFCAGSHWYQDIINARIAFDQAFGQLKGRTHLQPNKHVTVTGALFFDDLHGQLGVAANGIEIHPCIDFKVL